MPHHVNHHHHAAHEAREADGGVATEVSVVYVTAAPTFAGPIGGYSTPTMPKPSSGAPNFFDGGASSGVPNAPLAAGGQQAPKNPPVASGSILGVQATAGAPAASSSMIMAPSNTVQTSALPSNIQSQPSVSPSSAVASSIVPVGKQQTTLSSISAPSQATSASAQAASAAPQAPVESKNSGMSGGAKAGLAIGLILLVAILAAIGFLFYRKKKSMDAQKHQLDDEKSNQAAGLNRGGNLTSPSSTAPRLSLKPNNDAFPQDMNEKQAAFGGLAPVAAPTARGRTPEPQTTTVQENEKSNPFGDHAKLGETADAALAPKPLNISRPSTPTQGEKSAPAPAPAPTGPNGAPAGAAAPANGPNGPLNVHRVQLDFAPSMDDELGLRQGQLVRMLHEYDDGWCLCVRLDRSQQGVCPRSCISKLPVKPRPPPGQRPKGPPQAGSRPGTPQGPNGAPRARSNSNAPVSNGSRPATPNDGPFGEGQYRANSIEDQKKQSPTYEASLLSNSPNQSPPSSPESKQAPIARKPAPGSAA